MATPSITIGTVTVKGDEYGNHDWPVTMGIQPPRVVWQFAPDDAQALLDGPQEVTLTVTDSAGVKKEWKRIYVVGEEHSPDKLVRSVILTDVRFYLSYGWVRSFYNIMVASGTLRQVVADGLPVPFLPAVANQIYAPYSLKGSDDGTGGVPWTLDQIAADVLNLACTGHDFQAIVVRNKSSKRTSTAVQRDIYVDATGDVAVGQTLGAVGGLDIRVAADGAIEIVEAYLGAEKSTVDPIVKAYSLERKGVLRWVDMSHTAPAGAKILVTRYCEVRADSWESQPGSGALDDDQLWGTDNNPSLINVIGVTDPQLITQPGVKAIPAGQSAVQGTLLPVDTYCPSVAALGDAPGPSNGVPGAQVLSRSYLLQGVGGNGACSPMMSNALERNFQAQDIGLGFSNLNWALRCNALHDLRKRYKLNPVFARQCLPGSIKAERAGLLDAATATRQPATVWMDYVQRPAGPGWAPSDKFGWQVNSIPGIGTSGGDNPQGFGTGIKTYLNDSLPDNPFPLSSAKPAPWRVAVEDPTTGVFTFAPSLNRDLATAQTQTMAGLIWGLPVTASDQINKGNTIANWAQGKMLLTHRVAVVFSAIPGGPREAALQVYKVSVTDALSRLGAPSDAVTPKAPMKELRVREGQCFARIAWDDAQRQNILGCFSDVGVGDPSVLVPVNNLELQDFATAVFANYMAAVLNHYEGTMQVGWSPEVMPSGSLHQVIHSFGSDGRFYTTLSARGTTPVASPENLISQASRNVLFRGIQ